MGNGVVNQNQPTTISNRDFSVLEKRWHNGYYHEHFFDYEQTLMNAIQQNAIDMIEILIPSGNIKKLKPLHYAAKHGKLEALEILLSAGFSCCQLNERGETPLHICCTINTLESGLCATLIIIMDKRVLNVYDDNGFLPIHTIALHNNSILLETFISMDLKLNQKTKTGKTALMIAKENHFKSLISMLKSPENVKDRIQRKVQNVTKSPVDQERIMQIWEKFFENAFMRLANDEVMNEMKYEETNISNKIKKPNLIVDTGKRIVDTPSKSFHSVEIQSFQYENWESTDVYDNNQIYFYWFRWVVCYSPIHNPIEEGDINNFYVINLDSKESMWLIEYIEMIKSQRLFHTHNDWNNPHLFIDKPYPSTLWELVEDGWITCYDTIENYCKWISLPTILCEYYLPLGYNATNELLTIMETLQLKPSDDDPIWYESDQYCATSWVIVFMSNQGYSESKSNKSHKSSIDHDVLVLESISSSIKTEKYFEMKMEGISSQSNRYKISESKDYEIVNDMKYHDENEWDDPTDQYNYYYMNRVTGQTSWVPPLNWDNLIKDWGGWSLCCNEESCDELYWYDFESGESQWVEE